jgi:hypothetical protein
MIEANQQGDKINGAGLIYAAARADLCGGRVSF